MDLSYLEYDVSVKLFVNRKFSCLTEGHYATWKVTNERESPRVHEVVLFKVLL